MRKLLVLMAWMSLTAGLALGQELEIKDRISLGEKANASACFSPDGKKVLLANADSDKESISYTLIGADGKNKKEVYKFKLGQLKQYRQQEVFNVFNSRQGIFSDDGSMFLTCPDLDKEENMRFLYLGIPVVTCDMDGKTALVRRANQTQQSTQNYLGGLLIINSAFGKNDDVYYAIPDRAIQDENGLSGSSKIMKFDVKTKQAKTLANLDAVVAPIIFISPDHTRLAGIIFNVEISSNHVYTQSVKLWAYDIPSGKIAYSMPLGEQIYNMIPYLVWSQDNSTIYASMVVMGNSSGLKVFRPFVSPQKPDQEEAKEYKDLTVQLGDEDYKKRDSASAKLRSAGAKAVETLEEASRSTDPEIATRAKKLLADMTGKVSTLLDRRNVESFIEVAPGYLCVKIINSTSMSIVDVANRRSKTITISDKLVLIDKVGELGLFKDPKDQSLSTAKIVFTAAESQPASQPDSQ